MCLLPCFVLVVGPNDPLHQMVAHYVALVEVHEADSIDTLQNVDRFNQPLRRALGKSI